jgi:hypothetical protein
MEPQPSSRIKQFSTNDQKTLNLVCEFYLHKP